MKKILIFLVAVAFLLTGAQAFATDAYSTNVTKSGMFVEISGLTVGDVSWTVPDMICSSTAGCNIDWIMFIPAAQNDRLSIKWLDEDGIDIFPNVKAEDTYDAKIVYYGGDAIPFFLDLSASTMSTGSKVLIKLMGPPIR